ncbi:MAG: efflux RND transporter permease subunit [Acidobacteriota bacterium]
MKITNLTIKRPVTTFMFFLAVILLGFVSLRELSVDLLPDISYPRLSVVTQYSGVAPEEIETLVTAPLESAVSQIPGLRRVESVSKEGVSYMTLEFGWGTDMDFALLHTREKLDGAQSRLPEDVEEPTIYPMDPQSRPIMVLSVSGERSLLELKEFSEELIKPRLEQIEGIGSAEIAGGVEREIQVEVNPQLLALYDLTIDQISQRIDAFNRNLQGGNIRKGRFKYSLRVVGEFETVQEIGDISLKTTADRGVVRLKDIADIKDSIKEREGLTRLNGSESIGILVRKEAGANTIEASRLVRDVLDEIRSTNKQLNIQVVSEQARYIENAIASVVNSILLGAVLAFFVLLIFLQDLKTPVIISAVIPISIIATFNLLFYRGVSLNIMSLGGLALGVGMLVDNSIVVSESIFRHKGLGKSLSEAAFIGTKEVGMAVTASTFTTISVFLPVIYVHGVAGQLFKDQALTVTFAMLSSLVVSLTLLPMLASRRFEFQQRIGAGSRSGHKPVVRILPKKNVLNILLVPVRTLQWLVYFIFKAVIFVLNFLLTFIVQLLALVVRYLSYPLRPLAKSVGRIYTAAYGGFENFYHRFLDWSLANKGKVILSSFLILVLTLLLATRIPQELMPKPEAEFFEVHIKTPIDYSLEQTADVVASLEAWLGDRNEVVSSFAQIGIVSGMESLNPDVSLNSAKVFVEAKKAKLVDAVMEGAREYLGRIPGLNFSIIKEQATLSQFLAFNSAEVGIRIKGEDLNRLKIYAGQLVEGLGEIPEIADINTNIGEGKPEFLVSIRKEALEKYNIAPGDISRYLINAVRGRRGTTQYNELEKKYDILVRLEERTRKNIESLLDEQISIGEMIIPIRELVSYTIAKGPKEIRRDNQTREVLVTANLEGVKISEVVPRIQEKIDALDLPPNYRAVFSGEQEEMKKSFNSLIFAFCLAVLLVYMIMAAQFESLKHPFIILFTLPMGMIGAVWALFITGQTLNVISIIGMVMLAGIVVNDAIVKIDYTNRMRREGKTVREAILEASRVRLRPILITTVTTAFGLFPMSLGLGKGSELQQPLAITVIGGLLIATFLTLILIPVFYELFEKQT